MRPVTRQVVQASNPTRFLPEYIIEKLVQATDASGPTDLAGVQSDSYRLLMGFALRVEPIETVFRVGGEFRSELVGMIVASNQCDRVTMNFCPRWNSAAS